MSALRSVAYTSRAAAALGPGKLDSILLDAQLFNAGVQVGGVLFYSGDKFFQYIEGEDDAIELVLARIRASSSHDDLTILLDRRVERREFEGWHMGFCVPPVGAMQELSQANWQSAMPVTRGHWERSEGLGLALYYWSRWLAEKRDAGATEVQE